MRTKNELLNDYPIKAKLEVLIDIRDVLVGAVGGEEGGGKRGRGD